jgi:hypothetical protein
MPHTLAENALFTPVAMGTFINGNFGGTTSTVAAGAYEYHLCAFFGTLANNGTINVYGCTNSAGSSPNVLSTLNVGSANGAGAAIMVKSDVLNSLQGGTLQAGTQFTHLAMAGTVESGGTWRGAFVIISHQARSKPTTNGLAALGSALF